MKKYLHRSRWTKYLVVISFLFIFHIPAVNAYASSAGEIQEPPIVRAVLFFSPTCPHCIKVINEDLPPLVDEYGSQLDILLVNVTTKEGEDLYFEAMEIYKELKDRPVVPALIVGDTILLGSIQIPSQFPAIIEDGVTGGGIDWPSLAGLEASIQNESSHLQAQEPSQNSNPPLLSASPTPDPGDITSDEGKQESKLWKKFRRDLAGNTLAVVVLVGMIISVIYSVYRFFTASDSQGQARTHSWVIPVLCLLGLGVAGYLTYVEITHVAAVCGPVGDCNTVQQSSYATIWGVIPVGMFGIIGYLGIGLAWFVYQYSPVKLKTFGALAMWGMALLGTLFSIYLTFLEPFVIGATCIWCITSAIVITLLLLTTTGPALQASIRMSDEDDGE